MEWLKKRKTVKQLCAFTMSLSMLSTLVPVYGAAQETETIFYGLQDPCIEQYGVSWDCIWYGNYWQNDTNGDGTADRNDDKEPIKWRVLSINGDDAFLMADKILDARKIDSEVFTEEYPKRLFNWQICTARSWLNGYNSSYNHSGEDYTSDNFLNNAFSKEEQESINETYVINENCPERCTTDKIYLLSVSEAMYRKYGFCFTKSLLGSTSGSDTREAETTAYTSDITGITSNGYNWALRSVDEAYRGWFTYVNGTISNKNKNYISGNITSPFENQLLGIRPVMHLDLSSAKWSYAGKANSNGEPDEDAQLPEKYVQRPLKSPEKNNGTVTWDCVWLGNYWQNDTNGDGIADKNDDKEPIKWRVLSAGRDDAFLISDKVLDYKFFDECVRVHANNASSEWQNSSLRSWLNGYNKKQNNASIDYTNDSFLNDAFSNEEQSIIKETKVVDHESVATSNLHSFDLYHDTIDKIYILSYKEALQQEYGFSPEHLSDEARIIPNTSFVPYDNKFYFLRTPGESFRRITSISTIDGSMDKYGGQYDGVITGQSNMSHIKGVVPVMHIKLQSRYWNYAGTVSSDGTMDEIPPSSGQSRPEPKPSDAPAYNTSYQLGAPRRDNSTVTWDCIYFGNYWQNDTNGDGTADQNDDKEPVKWRILSIDGDNALLLSDMNLDCINTVSSNSWMNMPVRSWLNGYNTKQNNGQYDYSDDNFLINTFNQEEQDAIVETKIKNPVNSEYNIGNKGSDTNDKIYLLSIEETLKPEYGFANNYYSTETRKAQSTAYTEEKGACNYNGSSCWYLRSPGHSIYHIANTGLNGNVNIFGIYPINTNSVAIRPALRIDLSSSCWQHAGTVSSPYEPEEKYGIDTDEPPVPGTDEPPVPGTDEPPAPGTDEPPAPGTDEPPAPGTDEPPVPGTDETPVPGADETPIPGTDETPVPGADETPIPGTDETPAPGADETPVPDNGNNTAQNNYVWPSVPAAPASTPKPTITPTVSPKAPDVTVKPSVTPEAATPPVVIPATAAPVQTPGIQTPLPVTVPHSTPFPEEKVSAKPSSSPGKDLLKTGTRFSKNKLKAVFQVTKTGKKGTVAYVGSTKKNPSSIVIPETVSYNGVKYKVTSIAKKAFANNTKLKEVTIGKNITDIGAKAFLNNTSLVTLTIPAKVYKIGNKAFYGCSNLRIMRIETKKLKENNIGKNAFYGTYNGIIIKTWKSKWKLYESIFSGKGIPGNVIYNINM